MPRRRRSPSPPLERAELSESPLPWDGSQRPNYPGADNAAVPAAAAPAFAAPAADSIARIEAHLLELKGITGITANPNDMMQRLRERSFLYGRISDIARSEKELIKLDIRRSEGRNSNNNNNNNNASLGGRRGTRRKSKA